MESSRRERLSALVEELTTSGEPQLNRDKMKEMKKLVKVSEAFMDHAYHSVMSQLKRDHAEIRLSAFQIAGELFSRSHQFRTLLVDDFQEFLELTVETDSEQPLPPPNEVARKLRSLAIRTVQSWQGTYGTAYKKLALGYHFLKQVKKVDFQDVESRTVAERRREEERQRRMEALYREKVEAASKDMDDSYLEIQATLTEMESCMRLLLPEVEFMSTNSSSPKSQPANEHPPADDQPCCSKHLQDGRRGKGDGATEDERSSDEKREKEEEGSSEEEEDEHMFIRSSGLISHAYSLELDLRPGLHVKETEDNEAVVAAAIELYKLMKSKHLPAVQGWVQVFTKSGAEQQLLRRALDLKSALEAALQKHQELHIECKSRLRLVTCHTVMKKASEMKASSDGEDDEDEDDFDEVPEKEGYEPHIPEHLRAEYGLDPSPSASGASPPPSSSSSSHSIVARRLKRLAEEEQDPTCAAATLHLLRKNRPLASEPSRSTGPGSDQKAADAPVVPFGLDLYYWGQEQPNAGKIIRSASQHQFWVHTEVEEETENKELLAESKSRYISFPGSFTPVGHFCKAPLGNGALCQRQDRHKCPFHGQIIPRDEEGRALGEEDRLREAQEERRKREEQPDWRDAELMRDIEAATGENLGSDRLLRKGKGKKKKYPNLSDLKKSTNTSRSRLEKKVFNKAAMRRVAQVMSKADRRKHDKFSNQFNYAFS
ncbi:UV-stimulated scaffold protein A isoform X2 [Brachionichthys hirsutus]|uniref:UV-stimulated scaffold protein A isoform X2 n=1 Tax=Brachionichthys hirsutus TaxID=412623 RepID=UPI00360459AB